MNDLLNGLALLAIVLEVYVVNYSSEVTRQTDRSINVDYIFLEIVSFALCSCSLFGTFTDVSSK